MGERRLVDAIHVGVHARRRVVDDRIVVPPPRGRRLPQTGQDGVAVLVDGPAGSADVAARRREPVGGVFVMPVGQHDVDRLLRRVAPGDERGRMRAGIPEPRARVGGGCLYPERHRERPPVIRQHGGRRAHQVGVVVGVELKGLATQRRIDERECARPGLLQVVGAGRRIEANLGCVLEGVVEDGRGHAGERVDPRAPRDGGRRLAPEEALDLRCAERAPPDGDVGESSLELPVRPVDLAAEAERLRGGEAERARARLRPRRHAVDVDGETRPFADGGVVAPDALRRGGDRHVREVDLTAPVGEDHRAGGDAIVEAEDDLPEVALLAEREERPLRRAVGGRLRPDAQRVVRVAREHRRVEPRLQPLLGRAGELRDVAAPFVVPHPRHIGLRREVAPRAARLDAQAACEVPDADARDLRRVVL